MDEGTGRDLSSSIVSSDEWSLASTAPAERCRGMRDKGGLPERSREGSQWSIWSQRDEGSRQLSTYFN